MQAQSRGSTAPTGTNPNVSPIPGSAPSHPGTSSSGREEGEAGLSVPRALPGKGSPAQGHRRQSPAARPGPILPAGSGLGHAAGRQGSCAALLLGHAQRVGKWRGTRSLRRAKMALYHQGRDLVWGQTRAWHP